MSFVCSIRISKFIICTLSIRNCLSGLMLFLQFLTQSVVSCRLKKTGWFMDRMVCQLASLCCCNIMYQIRICSIFFVGLGMAEPIFSNSTGIEDSRYS